MVKKVITETLYYCIYHHSTKLCQRSLLPSVLLQVQMATRDIFAGIAWYYGGNDFIKYMYMYEPSISLHVQMQRVRLACTVPDTGFHVT